MNELTALLQAARKGLPKGIAKATVKTANAVVVGSPRFSGQLRASTKIGVNAPEKSVVIAPVYFFNAIPNAEFLSMSRFPSDVASFKVGDTLYVSNNLPYAEFQELEAGHLMFARAAKRFQSFLDNSF